MKDIDEKSLQICHKYVHAYFAKFHELVFRQTMLDEVHYLILH